MHFLGNVNSQGELQIDESKIRAIQDWEMLTNVTKLWLFHGLSNYYPRFISGYSTKAAPLKKLLKKKNPWVWSEEFQKAFEGLKVEVMEEPVFTLPDFSKTFEVHTYASNFVIGGVLMQDIHHITFKIRKLNEIEWSYTV